MISSVLIALLAAPPPAPRDGTSWIEWVIYIGIALAFIVFIRGMELAKRRQAREDFGDGLSIRAQMRKRDETSPPDQEER